MHRYVGACVLAILVAAPGMAQTQQQAVAQAEMNLLTQAQQVLTAAENAGAVTLAKSLYDDAQWRYKFAQENWSAAKRQTRDQARLRADEAIWAARAALAKAQWLGTNAAIRNLQTDITNFGGKSDLALQEESPTVDLTRGTSSAARADFAQAIIDQAKAAGAESIPGNDLKPAQDNINTAKKIARGSAQSESADHLAYDAEMMARRAYYLARANDSVKYLPGLQMQRTQLAQSQSEQQAAAERTRREQAEQQAAALQAQLAAEQSNRQAQQAEIDRLRGQIDENRRAMQSRIDADRAARLQAEQQLDASMQRYLAAIATGTASEVDTARRAVEDQQIALRAIQERERLNEQAMAAEVDRMRTDLDTARAQSSANPQLIASRETDVAQRQSAIEAMRHEREADLAHRTEVDRANQSAIAEAQQRRQSADAEAEALRAQAVQAQQQIQQANAEAQQANAQAQQANAQAAAAQQAAQQAQQAAQQAQQAAQQQAQQNQAELERTRQQMQQAQAELDKTRQELAARDAEMRRTQMQQQLSKVAATRANERGLIVTLPGIFFDTGKSDLKAGAKKTLTRIADQLKNDSTVRIAVEGHTDNVGKPEKNQTLSEKRANAVRDFLVSSGIVADRITAKGLGEADPIATNKTQAGRQQNRRVELVITNG